MGKPTGLVKRKGSAIWYFRQRCPRHLKVPGSPADIWISLETANYATALTRLDDARQEAQRRFAAPQSPTGIYSRTALPSWPKDDDLPMLSSEHAAPLSRAFLADAVRELDSEAPVPATVDDADKDAWRTELENMLARLTGPEPDDGIDDVAGARFGVLRKAKLRAVPGSEPLLLLHNYLRRAMAQSCKIELARLNGDYSDRITDRLFANCFAIGTVEHRAPSLFEVGTVTPSGVTERSLATATETYLAQLMAMPTSDKTKDRYRAELKHIAAFFGPDTPVWRINADECDRFRDSFALLPPNFEDKIREGKDIATIVATRRANDPVLAYATLEKYLSQLSRFLKWAHRRDYIAKNYAEGLKPQSVKPDGSMAKLPFEDVELRRIFQRPIYTGCRDDRRGFSKPGPNIVRRARYWAPLIGLFAGLRCGEILQLTTDHFRVSPEGHDFIVLTPDMKLKSENAIREIPLHPVLKAIGLVEWVQRRRDRGELALFPEVPAHSNYDDQSSRFSKWFESDLRHFDLGERRKKLTFHSFRHTFKRALDRADVREDKKEELCGWARGSRTSRRYGIGLEADVLKASVDATKYDLDLSHLYEHAKLND
ncbi:site-specific integrase [Novosphingobium sp.]|uniref:site-specific integrase n=1 Tax=Novosphingobium sp. TaxID=1874826 RepID=UPI0025ECFACF|nr:site-specific integrase [Novosphingobium sp.]MCC6925116.1 site-specific integrase [Novosphingobium sp.]